MIRVHRPPHEPRELALERHKHLEGASRLPGAAGPLHTHAQPGRTGTVHQPTHLVPGKDLTGYEVARPTLFVAQHFKCAYCETCSEEKWQDTEHFRPKASYWWLTWTWENLLFACKHCNTAKGAQFPLRSATCLQPKEHPPGGERPLLVDPADPCTDPMAHIVFAPVNGQWRPLARAGSRHGATMIGVLGLDRGTLRDLYKGHAQRFEDAIRCIQKAMSDRQLEQVQQVWKDVCGRWLSADAPFAALSHDILAYTFPKVRRDQFGLTLAIHPPKVTRPSTAAATLT